MLRVGAVAISVAMGWVVVAAAADEASINVEFRYGVWESDRSLTDLTSINVATVAMKAQAPVSAASRVRIDGLAALERASDGTTSSRTHVREAILASDLDSSELRVGWQSFAWGRADRINPTDVLTPRNYRLLVPVDEEQQIGVPALSLAVMLSDAWRMTGIVQRFVRSRMPSDEQEAHLPHRVRGPNTEWAAKLDRTGEGVDWSLSYVRGHEKARAMILAGCQESLPTAMREHPAIQMIGADVASVWGGYGIRGELARVDVLQGESSACGGRSDYSYGVLGLDRNLPHDVTLGVQWFIRHYDDDLVTSSPILAQFQAVNSQTRRTQPGISLRYAQRFFNDQLDWEWVVIYKLGTQDYAIRPRLTYRYTDQVRVLVGADVFRGDAMTTFGLLKENSGAFIELHVELL